MMSEVVGLGFAAWATDPDDSLGSSVSTSACPLFVDSGTEELCSAFYFSFTYLFNLFISNSSWNM